MLENLYEGLNARKCKGRSNQKIQKTKSICFLHIPKKDDIITKEVNTLTKEVDTLTKEVDNITKLFSKL